MCPGPRSKSVIQKNLFLSSRVQQGGGGMNLVGSRVLRGPDSMVQGQVGGGRSTGRSRRQGARGRVAQHGKLCIL